MHNHQLSSTLNKASLVLALCFFTVDLTSDYLEGEDVFHQIGEFLVFAFILGVLIFQFVDHRRIQAELNRYAMEQNRSKKSLDLRVKKQFEQWNLTPSESETAWLIIKGFSFEEIAKIRSVKGKTARQQATSIYAKSGTTSRSDFTGLFIEDILNANNPLASDEG